MAVANILQTRAHTKIVATIGPACKSQEQLAALLEAGVDVFRLNMAHGQVSEHQEVLERIRRLSIELDRPSGVLVDLGGPKIRLGEFPGDQVEVHAGEEVKFVRGSKPASSSELTSSYPRLVDELEVGNRVMLADGTVMLLVEERSPDSATCRVIQPGPLRSRQGINLPGVKVSLPAMSEHDREHAVWAAKHGLDFVSLSFVRSPVEVQELKWLLRANGSRARVIAKIEKQEALDRLDEIVAAADGIMVARGDLGVEIDVARMPVVQKEIVRTCARHGKPVIIATQMLDSMQHSRRPTRAEVTDVANAILDGADACMLSGETAVGEYPREAVEMMNRVALATEELLDSMPMQTAPEILPEDLKPITAAVVFGAGHIARQLDARLVVAASHTGATALAFAKQRRTIPTVGVSDDEATLRQMCLYWGVIPLAGAPSSDSNALLKHIEAWGLKTQLLSPGDCMVLVAGTSLASGHNILRVYQVPKQ